MFELKKTYPGFCSFIALLTVSESFTGTREPIIHFLLYSLPQIQKKFKKWRIWDLKPEFLHFLQHSYTEIREILNSTGPGSNHHSV